MKRSKFLSVVSIASITVFSFAMSGCSLLPKEQADAGIAVVTVPKDIPNVLYAVTKGDIKQVIQGVGRVTGIQDSELTFTQSRRLAVLNVKVGDRVTKGDLLAELDDQGQKEAAEQAEINLERTQIQLNQAEEKANNKLDSYDKQLLDLNIQSAQVAYDDAESHLSGLDMVASFSGVVLQVNGKVGQQVDAGKTLIQLTDPSGVALKVPFTKDDSKGLKAGLKAICLLSSAPTNAITATLTSVPDFSNMQPSVTSSDPNAQSVDTVLADATFKFDKELSPNTIGDSVDVTVVVAEHDHVMELPTNAVRQMGNSSFVIVYNGLQKKEVQVTTGLTSSTMTEIVKGLSVGDKVVGK